MPILRRSVVQFCSAPLVRFHTALDTHSASGGRHPVGPQGLSPRRRLRPGDRGVDGNAPYARGANAAHCNAPKRRQGLDCWRERQTGKPRHRRAVRSHRTGVVPDSLNGADPSVSHSHTAQRRQGVGRWWQQEHDYRDLRPRDRKLVNSRFIAEGAPAGGGDAPAGRLYGTVNSATTLPPSSWSESEHCIWYWPEPSG